MNAKFTAATLALALLALGVTLGLMIAALVAMPAPRLDAEAIAATCTTDAECEYWADRLGGK